MPNLQSGVVSNYDFGAGAAEAALVGWRVRNNAGGKVKIVVEVDGAESGTLTYSMQVAPALASGLPDTFVDTTAALNLEAVVDETVGPAQNRSHEILLRPGQDAFLLLIGSGSIRGRVQLRSDSVLDLWRTADGVVELTPV